MELFGFTNNRLNGVSFSFLSLDMVVSNSVLSHNTQFLLKVFLSKESRVSLLNSSFVSNTCKNTSQLAEMVGIKFPRLVAVQVFMQNVTVLENACSLSLFGITPRRSSLSSSSVTTGSVLQNRHSFGDINSQSGEKEANQRGVVTIKELNVIDNISGLEGAVLIQSGGDVFISNSTFKNNFGYFKSWCLYVQGGMQFVKIYNTTFLQTQDEGKLQSTKNGFIYFANPGSLVVINSTLKLEKFGNINAFLLVNGARSVEIVNSASIVCPIDTTLTLRNMSFWESMSNPETQIRVLTYSFQCNACPLQTYSLKRGHSNGFTLKNYPCHRPCPTGANCSHNIAAKPNYWGSYHIDRDEIEFKYCPIGYCCPSVNYSCPFVNDKNASHTGCQGNREGTLCGKCIGGYSQTLFSGQCRVSSECTDNCFWPLSITCAILFTSYLLFKYSILPHFKAQVLWFLSDNSIVPRDSTRDSGYLKIVFYFYQVSGLLLISTNTETLFRSHAIIPLVELFNFKIGSFNTGVVCPFSGLTALTKTLFEALLVLVILLIIPLIYTVHVLWARVRFSPSPSGGRYLAAAVEVFLLGYAVLASTSLKLLNCVTVESHLRWFYGGTEVCFQWWQGLSALFIVVYVVSFAMVLFWGTRLLHMGSISVRSFLCAFGFPLPWVISQTFLSAKRFFSKSPTTMVTSPEEPDITEQSRLLENVQQHNGLTSSVLQSLSAPFREPIREDPGTIYWDSVLIGRRFVLICLHTFIIDQFLRQVVMSLTCLLILIHHMSKAPYRDPRANSLETVSLTALIVIAT